MPIHFRCAYCQQLLGIARRKAGTIISCPTCNGRIVVPKLPDPAGVTEEPPGDEPALLERDDFEAMFQPPAPGKLAAQSAVTQPAPPSAREAARSPSLEMDEPSTAASPSAPAYGSRPVRPGHGPATTVEVARGQLILWLVVGGVLLIGAFLAGVLVGHFAWPRIVRVTPKEEARRYLEAESVWEVVNANAARAGAAARSVRTSGHRTG